MTRAKFSVVPESDMKFRPAWLDAHKTADLRYLAFLPAMLGALKQAGEESEKSGEARYVCRSPRTGQNSFHVTAKLPGPDYAFIFWRVLPNGAVAEFDGSVRSSQNHQAKGRATRKLF